MEPESGQEALIDRLAATAGDLPSMPKIIEKVLRLVQDPSTEVADLRRVIELDPGLTAKLLRVANSAYYHRQREILSLNHAILTLGFKTIVSLALASSTKTVFDQCGQVAARIRQTLWDHSILTAFLSVSVCRISGAQVDPELCFLGGLLHDIGKLTVSRAFPLQYRQIRQAVEKEGADQGEREAALLGFRHEALGARIVKDWGLPEPIEVVIRHHHTPAEAPSERTETAIVALANRLATEFGWNFPMGVLPPLAECEALGIIGLDPALLMSQLDELRGQVEAMRHLF